MQVILCLLLFATTPGVSSLSTFAGDKPAPVLRDQFTVQLHTNNGEYKEQFDKVPYVAENIVYVFAGDHFGIHVGLSGDDIAEISYENDLSKADVTFKFTQEKGPMMLFIESKLKRQLFLDALMTVPKQKGFYKTSILGVGPGLIDVESWPHPIVQLVLKNFRFTAKPAH